MTVEITEIVTGAFVENAYLVHDTATGDAVIVDPGDNPGRIVRTVEQAGAKPKAVLLTHAHIDHAGAAAEIQEHFDVPLYCHAADEAMLDRLGAQARMFGIGGVRKPRVDHHVEDGQILAFGSLELKVLHTPGHTPGGVCYLVGDRLLAGDTLFAGSIGRTDLPGGSYEQIIDSIRDKILGLDDSVRVYTGHGPETTVGRERRTNPFLT
jgi:glyoxylase-like metal-dependent hydrolase (beta-lactamase superfamily II)